MNLRNRLSFISSLIFGVIFSIAAALIYFTFYRITERSVIKELQKTCLIAAIYYLEKDEQPVYEHQEVKRQFESLINSNMVAVYDINDQVKFGDLHNDKNITQERLRQLKKDHKHHFQSKHHFYYGMYYADNQGDFYVFIKESNETFKSAMNRLLIILIIVLLAGWFSIIILSKILSKLAYIPIKNTVEEIKNKELNNLYIPISSINSKDELQELIDTYNHLLKRISDNFAIQRNFINYVSHEFRTPLTVISGTLEVYLQKKRTPEEYEEAIKIALDNVEELKIILNNMLLLTEAKNTEKTFKTFRIDEIVWEIITHCQEKYHAQIDLEWHIQNQELLLIKGNEVLIQLALLNIVENGIKYSGNKPIRFHVSNNEDQLTIQIIDKGIGINAEDIPFIQETFYRGSNTDSFNGSGVGLSLASIIFKEHNIIFEISSSKNGTTVTLYFPKL